jgi:hypothetical protein
MPAYVLVSAKGSPGVTTAAAALAAVATTNGRPLLAELDPSGGSVQVLTGSPAGVGLMEAAGQLRREASPSAIDENVTVLPAGVPTLLAPAAGAVAESVIDSVGGRWVPTLRSSALDVFVDAGRWEPSQRTALRVVGADLLVVVCRPTVAGVEHTRHLLDRLREIARRPAAAVVVGDRPYPPEQVAGYLDVPLAGYIAWDARGATSLWAHGVTRVWLRSQLARSAVLTLAGLAAQVPNTTAAGSVPRPAPRTNGPTAGAAPAAPSAPAPPPAAPPPAVPAPDPASPPPAPAPVSAPAPPPPAAPAQPSPPPPPPPGPPPERPPFTGDAPPPLAPPAPPAPGPPPGHLPPPGPPGPPTPSSDVAPVPPPPLAPPAPPATQPPPPPPPSAQPDLPEVAP